MKKIFSVLLIALLCCTAMGSAEAAKREILFVPHDNRPVSCWQTADTVDKLADFAVKLPPEELLGNNVRKGEPDKLWSWLEANAGEADAVVLSADAMLYGSLVNSRKHKLEETVILQRAEKFKELRAKNPKLKIYVFGSVMRTPRQGGGSEEPEYYAKYGADIFQLTAFLDKQETEKLTGKEKKQLKKLRQTIPEAALQDWFARRERNFVANKYLVELAKRDVFNYLVLGRDDNAPYSQTHKESRYLKQAGAALSNAEFQVLAGIDEMGLILLTRAVNDLSWQVPLVHAVYADGSGAATVPSYSDERIDDSIKQHLTAAGGIYVSTAKRADLIMVVSTREDGTTSEANWPANQEPLAANTAKLVEETASLLKAGKKVALADIAFANGADNALLNSLQEKRLLSRLNAYAGWNTATNSTGFALGQGILSLSMTEQAKNDLLAVRYLDDWAYQANVRQSAANQLNGRNDGSYMKLGAASADITAFADKEINEFAEVHLAELPIEAVNIAFPWNRMFEADVRAAE